MPALLLQPIVENAIRHGPRRASTRGNRHRGPLPAACWSPVTDEGAENGEPVTGPERVGLGNTRARLEALYGAACRLELTRAEGRGARVTVHIPRRSWNASPADAPSRVNGSEGG